MAQLLPNLQFQAFDQNGVPLAGGKLYSYLAGSSTPAATYTDQTQTQGNPNPIVLNSTGVANVWIGTAPYKFVLTDMNGVVQWTKDNVTSLDASEITIGKFAPGLFTADATGRAPFQDGFIDRDLLLDGVLENTDLGRAKMADGFLSATATGQAKMAPGFLSADATGRAFMAAGFITPDKLAAIGVITGVTSGIQTIGPAASGTTFATISSVTIPSPTGRQYILLLVPDGVNGPAYMQYTTGSAGRGRTSIAIGSRSYAYPPLNYAASTVYPFNSMLIGFEQPPAGTSITYNVVVALSAGASVAEFDCANMCLIAIPL